MSANAKYLFRTWFLGVIVGTAIVAVTSPIFVRSYVPLRFDSVRGVYRLASAPSYRWRSEGYADTVIGPLGMPGRVDLPDADEKSRRVALWGDSQVEGFAVSDDDKIYAQTERMAAKSFAIDDSKTLVVLPFARSGEDASDWFSQLLQVETQLAIDVHVILVAEVVDLATSKKATVDVETAETQFEFANDVPAFAIQAARNLLTTGEGSTLRQLRFSIGPTAKKAELNKNDVLRRVDWQSLMRATASETKKPIVLVYAPVLPSIVGPRIGSIDHDAIEFERLKQSAQFNGIVVVDLRDELLNSASNGRWPHGFHNGRFGSGHLNRIGNKIVAGGVLRGIQQAVQEAAQRDGEGSN
jgi:hypothetical protein